VRAPLVLGHEASGEVVQLGGGVTELRVGARVTLEPGVPCWHSHLSREGRYNLDPDIVFAATPPHHGSLMQYADHPADWCFALPDVVSFEQGAFCEPLSVGIHAVRRGRIAPGLRVAVLGAGPIGLVTLMSARVFGADKVVVSDLSQHKLDVAAAQGVRHTRAPILLPSCALMLRRGTLAGALDCACGPRRPASEHGCAAARSAPGRPRRCH
jgi:L-iditol 2-dehydrogenase